MAGKHPYISSGGPLVQAITQFRKSFPGTVDASTLKKLGIASNNESCLINILKFLNLISDEGSKTDKAAKAFVLHKDEDFDLPLVCHPAAIRASARFASCDAGLATGDRRSWSGLRSRSPVALRLAAKAAGVRYASAECGRLSL
jgi:hypothetical protein